MGAVLRRAKVDFATGPGDEVAQAITFLELQALKIGVLRLQNWKRLGKQIGWVRSPLRRERPP